MGYLWIILSARLSISAVIKKKHWKFLHHTQIADDLKVCHDFDPKSLGMLQVTGRKSCIIRVQSILFHGETFEVSTSHRDCLLPGGVIWFKVIWASLEPLEGTVHNSCVVYSFLMEIHLKFLLHTKIAWPTKDLRLCLESLAKGYLDTLRVIVKMQISA